MTEERPRGEELYYTVRRIWYNVPGFDKADAVMRSKQRDHDDVDAIEGPSDPMEEPAAGDLT